MNDFYKNKKVLITGHTGFKGGWLALWLQKMGATVAGYALPAEPDESLFELAGVGEQMEGRDVTPDGGVAWNDFSDQTYDAAQRSIHDLINGAADVSEWAVALGVAGLTPHPPIAIRCTTTGWEVAVQIATADDTTDQARDELLRELRTAITETTCRVLGLKPA